MTSIRPKIPSASLNNDWSKRHAVKLGKSGTPYYVKKLSFTQRYPRFTVISITSVSLSILFLPILVRSIHASIYPEKYGPSDFLWRSERLEGKTNVQKIREYKARDEIRKKKRDQDRKILEQKLEVLRIAREEKKREERAKNPSFSNRLLGFFDNIFSK